MCSGEIEKKIFFFIFLQKVGMWNFEKLSHKYAKKEMMKSFVEIAS